MPSSWQRPGPGVQTVWILLLALAAWSGSIVRGGFSYDDREAIDANPVVESSLPWTAAFEQDYWSHRGDAGLWRPLALLALRVDHSLWGDEGAAGFHATNVLLHLLVIVLAAGVLRLVCEGQAGWGPAWFGLALFAVHPVLADSVAWISGRSSMLAAIGGLVGALGVASIAGHGPEKKSAPAAAVGILSAAGLFVALSGKEIGIVFAPLTFLIACRISKRAAAASALGSAVAVLGWMWMRKTALGAWLPESPQAMLAGQSLFERVSVSGRAVVEGIRIALLPLDYPPNYRPEDVVGEVKSSAAAACISGLGWGALLILGGGGALAVVLGRRGARLAGASALLVCGACLPHMQLIPSGEIFAPRFLYLPLLFGAPLASATFGRVFKSSERGFAFAALVFACCIPMAWDRAGVYASRATYHRAVLRERPDDVSAWNALGNARKLAGDPEGARRAWLRAIETNPAYSRPWTNLGGLQLEEGDEEAAERSLRESVRVGPRNPVAHANLASFLLQSNRPAAAEALYARAVELAPGLAHAWRGLGRARLEQGDRPGAREALDRALELNPADERALGLRAAAQ